MIKVYGGFTDDFSGQGLGYIRPIRADVKEETGGLYEIEVELPIDGSRDDWVIDHDNIISAPAPTRTSPEINFGLSGTIKRQIYRANAAVYMYNLSNRRKILRTYRKNTEFVRLETDGDWYKVSAVIGGATGWVAAAAMVYSREAEEEVSGDSKSSIIESVIAREQYFRITNIIRNAAEMRVTAIAEHISYDLRGIICESVYAPENIPADEAVAQIMSRADRKDHPFKVYCQCTTLISGEYTGRNIIDCLLNADDGIVTQCGARFIRDNFDIYILDPADRYMGADIRYGDNLIKAIQETDSAERISRIRPVGKNKNGDPIYLTENGGYVDSPYAEGHAVKRTIQREYSEAQTGRNGLYNDAQTRAKLKQLAQAEFENGADGISAKIDAAFVRKELAVEYTALANEAALHLYDVTHVRAKRAGIVASVRMGSYTFDALPGRERYTDTRITDLIESDPMVYGGNIAAGSISGAKIRNGTIDGATKLKDLSVGYAKMDAAAIDRLNANSITAITGAFNTISVSGELYAAFAHVIELAADDIKAGNITTDKLAANLVESITGAFNTVTVDGALYAAFAHVVQLAADSITAGNVETDRLAAVLADIVTLQAATGKFDLATIQNLLSEALVLQQGQAGSMMITNLAVTSANLLNATVGELVLKGSDGLYYRVHIGADGIIHTEAVTVSEGEIYAGQTESGKQIVETTANIKDLNAHSITGESAVIDSIVTTALTAGKITASEALLASATIPALYTTAITAIGNSLDFSAIESIKMMVARKNATYYRDTEPEDITAGDTWIYPAIGKTYIAEGMTGKNLPEFSVDSELNLLYRFNDEADEFNFYIDEDGNLMASNQDAQVDENGNLQTTTRWVEVSPAELHTSYIDIAQDYIRINSGGNVRIGAGGTLEVESGAAHFKTSDYTLSILADDGTEDTVLDFDTESKTLRVDEIRANNVRPFVYGVTEVDSVGVGGILGLANMLEYSRYEHVIYTQTVDDYSTEPVTIEGCDSILVEIKSDGAIARVPPLKFVNANANIQIEGVEWNCPDANALEADSGNICIRNSAMTALNGIVASRHARVVWIGAAEDGDLESAGACTTDAFRATDGADIKCNAMIPSGALTHNTGGTITSIDTFIGGAGGAGSTETTVTLNGAFGNWSDEYYWDAGTLYQGYTSGKGVIYGCMAFALPVDVTEIKAATLTLHRVSGTGSGSAVSVYVFGSPTAYGSKPALGTRYAYRTNAVVGGSSVSLDVTAGAQALLAGTIRQLVLYTAETSTISGKVYSRNYARFDSAKLTITY